MNVTQETVIFLSFILSGSCGGIVFDFFRALRKNVNTSNFVVYIEDFLFWTFLGVIALCTSNFVSGGQIRVYMLLSMVLGAILYFFTFSKILYKVFDTVCRYTTSIIGTIIKFFKGAHHETKAQDT